MTDDDAARVLARAAEAWLDVVLIATAMALAPCEFSGRWMVAWARSFRLDA